MMRRNTPIQAVPKVSPTRLSVETPVPTHRVLVVEDHEDTRFMLKTILEMFDFSVIEAIDGQGAIEKATVESPDLILMDLSLPIMDGITATQVIRSNKMTREIPIVFLSGRAESVRRRDAFDAGCNDYLVKPVEIESMVAIMQRWLAPRANSAAAARGR